MSAIVLLIVVAVVSLLITRIATIALSVTGMAHEAARFQARSALSGVGYTTREAESVVNHPVRRRIVMTLMLVGNVGLVTAVAGLLGGFVGAGGQQAAVRTGLLVGGLVAVYLVSRSQAVDRRLSRLVASALCRLTHLDARDYASLLHVSGGYTIEEFAVDAEHWLAGRTLADCALRDEGVTVLGITREDGSYVGAPDGDTTVNAGDTLVLYGHRHVFPSLSDRSRTSGARDHEVAVARHHERKSREESDGPHMQETTALDVDVADAEPGGG